MEIFLVIWVSLIAPATAFVTYRYLQSSFVLLEQVREVEPLWEQLERPERVWVREMSGGISTIQPIFPWLKWLWAADTQGLDRKLARQLKSTSALLSLGLVLFALTVLPILLLALSAS